VLSYLLFLQPNNTTLVIYYCTDLYLTNYANTDKNKLETAIEINMLNSDTI
jgi:hypothetical protein